MVIERVNRNVTVEEVEVVDEVDREIVRVLNSGEDGNGNDVGSYGDVVAGNGGGGTTNSTASCIFFPPAFTGRKILFPNVGTDAGKSNGYQILRVAKRIGWDLLMKHRKRIKCLEHQMVSWFDVTGVFHQYNAVNSQRLNKFISGLLSHASTAFPLN